MPPCVSKRKSEGGRYERMADSDFGTRCLVGETVSVVSPSPCSREREFGSLFTIKMATDTFDVMYAVIRQCFVMESTLCVDPSSYNQNVSWFWLR